ncbi:fam-l protein [Plasmodium brasilianum]|uniref:Fam-l protein n=1 Tax=Plasmodium brasilianum TaxID=5824 RepID=A0ACB9YET8_PLABR|nr:fam-l protein [Plasmodium brasilianum]
MEQKIKLLLFLKISTFILLTWICNFYIYNLKYNYLQSTHNTLLDEFCKHCRKFYARNYRSLGIHNQKWDSHIVCLKEEIQNGKYVKNDASNNEKWGEDKKKLLSENLPYNEKGCKKDKKNKFCLFETNRYSYLERKIFKELDFEDFLKNNKTISGKLYKKIIRKKCSLRIAIPLMLLLLLSLALTVEFSLGYGISNVLYYVFYQSLGKSAVDKIGEYLKNDSFGRMFKQILTVKGKQKSALVHNMFIFLTYCSLFLILGFAFISVVFYYHKKVKKYQKMKFRKGKI